jgi:uncharacterized protein YndB with AHSA1/START domain
MKSKRLFIQINKPAHEVFEFVTNPTNTPKWIDSIVVEQTNESPPRLGTIYKNQNRAGEWSEYEMIAFEPNKMFIMRNRGSGYHVKYTLVPVSNDTTKLEYYEWTDDGELTDIFTMEILEKLKAILEKPV